MAGEEPSTGIADGLQVRREVHWGGGELKQQGATGQDVSGS